MGEIKIVDIKPLKDGQFIKPLKLLYVQNGVQKSWEIVKVHDSVAVLLYHRERDSFVLVKQFRPGLYYQHGYKYSYELCAGIVDKDKPLYQIAAEEILEETGYKVEPKDIKRVTSFFTSVGFAGSKQMLFYAEVDEEMRENPGGGIDEEDIEVVYLEVKKAKEFMFDENIPKTPGLLFAFCWWFEMPNSLDKL